MSLAVGLLHFTGPPVVGGVEAVLAHHARLMADAGHAVRVIVGRGGAADARVELVRLPLADTRHPVIVAMRAALDRGVVPPTFGTVVASLADDLRRVTADLDVLIAHNVCSLNVNVPLTTALYRVTQAGPAPRLVAWDHDIAATSARYRDRLYAGYPWDLYRRPWPRAIVVTVSQARRAELVAGMGLAPGAIRVIPNGIDTAAFTALRPGTRRLLDSLALRDARPVLLVPARLTPRKNLELAIAVLVELHRAGDDARLVITGVPDPHDLAVDGYLDQLRGLALASGVAAGVHFLADGPPAWRSSPVVADLYRVADALFLPSRDEGFGLPVLEAAAARLPVICADIPALRELGGDDATYFDPSGDPAGIATAIRRRLSADPAHRFAVRSRVAFSWSRLYPAHIEPLLLECAAPGPATPGTVGGGGPRGSRRAPAGPKGSRRTPAAAGRAV